MKLWQPWTPRPIDSPIGARLREFRGINPHSHFAAEFGVTDARWRNYESGRTALPWAVFEMLWVAKGLNPRWLYSGEGPQLLSAELFDLPFTSSQLSSRARFTDVYEKHLAEMFAASEGDLHPLRKIHIRQLERFLVAAREGRIPMETLHAVAFHALDTPAMRSKPWKPKSKTVTPTTP